MCRYYKWPHDFWRRMGRKEFYAWLTQMDREQREEYEQTPDSWKNTEQDSWWQQARERRKKMRDG